MTEFTISIDAAPGSGADVDMLERVHHAALAHPAMHGVAVGAHGDETDAAIGATFQVAEATNAPSAALIATTAFIAVLETAGVPEDLRRVDHLEVTRELEHAAA